MLGALVGNKKAMYAVAHMIENKSTLLQCRYRAHTKTNPCSFYFYYLGSMFGHLKAKIKLADILFDEF